MYEKIEAAIDDFTITKSRFFHKLLVRFRMDDSFKKGLLKRALVLAGITWLPLLILSALQGVAFGNKVDISFWKDFASHIRFLIVIPLLVLAEKSVDQKLKEKALQFFKSGILNEPQLNRFKEIKKSVLHLCESLLANLAILLIVITNLSIRLTAIKTDNINIWLFLPVDGTATLSWAGIFFVYVSVPILQFLILQWLWRWIIWVIYFVKLSKLPLKLNPAHPDLAGGIGFLGFPPGPFTLVTFAIGILFSAAIAVKIYFFHEKLPAYYMMMGGFVFFSVIINVMPLLVFIKPLLAHRRKGFFEYSALVQEHHRQFDNKWVGKPTKEEIIGFGDASSLTDFNTSFDTVKKMGFFPFNVKSMLSGIFIAMLPLIPLFAFEYNLLDLILKIVRMLA